MILAIETSCDETAAAIVEESNNTVRVLSNIISSQIELHAPWGGVVPNIAAREHSKNIAPVIETALREANATIEALEAIAVTEGPGLAPALQIGVTAAKTLAYLSHKPLLGIHHIEGHIYANFIREPATPSNRHNTLHFPLIALVVSGGHTELVLMRNHFEYEILGETEDDAAGEAFDKVAKMLNLPYPGGPEIAQRADKLLSDQPKVIAPFSFPRPLLSSHDYRLSFSGLKTAVRYFLKEHEQEKTDEAFVMAVCREFQNAVIDVLIEKTRRALFEYHPRTILIAGGVSANASLRTHMHGMVTRDFPDIDFLTPPFQYSLDNAAMIGTAAIFRWKFLSGAKKIDASTKWKTLRADPNMKLRNL